MNDLITAENIKIMCYNTCKKLIDNNGHNVDVTPFCKWFARLPDEKTRKFAVDAYNIFENMCTSKIDKIEAQERFKKAQKEWECI